MIRQMLTKKKLLQISKLIGLISIYVALLIYEMMSIRELGIIIAIIGVATAYIEYRRRKLFAEFKRETDRKLKQQADKFHDALWSMIFSRGWRICDHVALLHLDGEFIEIHPSPKYARTNPKYINRSNGNPKAATLNER